MLRELIFWSVVYRRCRTRDIIFDKMFRKIKMLNLTKFIYTSISPIFYITFNCDKKALISTVFIEFKTNV